MLVDSSVWIDFLRGTDSPETTLLKRCLADSKAIWLAPTVLQEVLQGADSPERLAKWSRVLGELPMIDVRNMRTLSIEAAKLYANCRWNGFTPRSANDCLIAVYAIHAAMPLLHSDRDFVGIAKIEPRLRLMGMMQD